MSPRAKLTRSAFRLRGPQRQGSLPLGQAFVRSGFTLLELVITVALLSLVLALTYGSFIQLSTHANKLRHESESEQELRLLMQLLQQDLEGIQWLSKFASDGNPSGLIADERFAAGKRFSLLRFHSSVSARLHRQASPAADPRLHEIAYWVEENETKLQLMRREDYYLDSDLANGGRSVALISGVHAFRIEFLSVEQLGRSRAEEQWDVRWDSTQRSKESRLPVAIRITLGLADEDGGIFSQTLEINLPVFQESG